MKYAAVFGVLLGFLPASASAERVTWGGSVLITKALYGWSTYCPFKDNEIVPLTLQLKAAPSDRASSLAMFGTNSAIAVESTAADGLFRRWGSAALTVIQNGRAWHFDSHASVVTEPQVPGDKTETVNIRGAVDTTRCGTVKFRGILQRIPTVEPF